MTPGRRKNDSWENERVSKEEKVEKLFKRLMKGGLGIIILLICIFVFVSSFLVIVPAGKVGVLFDKFQGGVQLQEFHGGAEGWGLKLPIVQSVTKMDVRTQTVEYRADTAITPKDKNGINFKWDVVVRYRLDRSQAAEVYKTKGEEYADKIIGTGLRARSREIMGAYAQEDLPEHRLELAELVRDALQDRVNEEASKLPDLKPNFLIIEAVDLRNLEFNPEIEQRIIQKQQRLQEAQEMDYRILTENKTREMEIIKADKDKQAKILRAQGEAEAVLAVARAKAEAIDLVNRAYQGMPNQYVQTKFAEAIKPTDKVYLGFDSLMGGNMLPVLNVNDVMGLQHSRAINITG